MKEKDLAIMEQFRKCIPIFSVLNDAKRQEIILILTDFPGEGLTVNGITERIDLSRPAGFPSPESPQTSRSHWC